MSKGEKLKVGKYIHAYSRIGFLLCVDREILNMESYFHKKYGIFIPKRLPNLNSCCFKASEAIELEPKTMAYFIFSASECFC